jgi:hypothetical protein
VHLGFISSFLAEGGTEIPESRNPVLNRKIGYGVVVSGRLRSNLSVDFLGGHQVNRSLLKIDKELQDIWSGNIIAYRFSEDTGQVKGLGPMSFRHIVDIIRRDYDHRRRELNDKVDGPTVTGASSPAQRKRGLAVVALRSSLSPHYSAVRRTKSHLPS